MRAGVPVKVEPQVFALLELLVRKAGDLVSRDEMIETIWQGRIVSDATVSARISAARAAVGDDGRSQAVIRTIVSVGLQLAVPVETVGPGAPVAEAMPVVPEPAVRPRIRFATAPDGTGLAWTAQGAGCPLMRGGHWLTHLELDSDNLIWRPLLERLNTGRRLIRYDPRGTGVSERECGPETLDAMVLDMKTIADAAGADRFDIFAPSQNAPVSISFAARHPDRVRRLVILGGYLQGAAVRGTEDSALSEAFVALVRNGWGRQGNAFLRSFSTFFMPDATEAQISAFADMQLASISGDRAVAHRQAISRLDASKDAPKVRAPTLVIHARNDKLQPFSQGQLIARSIPGAEFLALESANHIPLPQDPAWDVMMAGTEEFLGRD